MKLSEENKKRIIKEIDFVIQKIFNTEDLDESVFYFGAVHSFINRIFNIEFNQHLIFMHIVLENCYNIILKTVTNAHQGKQPITIDAMFFNTLNKYLAWLAKNIREEKSTFEVLEKISVLTYSITGNGYFLQKKGYDLKSYA